MSSILKSRKRLDFIDDVKTFCKEIQIMPYFFWEDKLLNEIKINPRILNNSKYLSLRNNKEFMAKAVKANIGAYDYMGQELKNEDVKIAIYVLSQDNSYFELLPNALKNNYDFIKIIDWNNNVNAINNYNFRFFTHDIDEKEALKLIMKNSKIYPFLPKKIKNEEFIKKCLMKNPLTLEFVDESFKIIENKDLILQAVKRNGWAYRFAGKLKEDEEVASAALNKTPGVMKCLDTDLLFNKEFILKCVEENPSILNYSDFRNKRTGKGLWYANNMEFMKNAFYKNPVSAIFASAELKNNEEFICETAKVLGDFAWIFVGDELEKDSNLKNKLEAIYDNQHSESNNFTM